MTAVAHEVSESRVPGAMRLVFGVSAALALAYTVFVLVRPVGAYSTVVDGWGVDVFEIALSGVCISRFFHRSWPSDQAGRLLPLLLGLGCLCWALGDVAITIESFGGATPSVPSVADGFYIAFYPLCYTGIILVLRRGSNGSLIATSLDALIAGLGVASMSAAFVFHAVLHAAGGSTLSAATQMAYPIGDLLLLAMTTGGLVLLSGQSRRFLIISVFAMTANVIGDSFNLLQPDSRFGSTANALAWPISILLLAIAAWVQPANAEQKAVVKSNGYVLGSVGAAGSLLILLTATFGHVGRAAVGFATATLVVAGFRMTLTVGERTARLAGRERHFKSLVENSSDSIVVVGPDMVVQWMNSVVENAFGWPTATIVGFDLNHTDADFAPLVSALIGLCPGQPASIAWKMVDNAGRTRFLESTITDLRHVDAVSGYVVNNRDVTDRTSLESQLRHQAFHDPLTGLANRALLLDRIEHALSRRGRTGMDVAVLLIDLDGFKDVNDSLGHQVGDQMICDVANKLRVSIRSGDTVARLGGDEFAIVMEDTDVSADATRIGERIRRQLAVGVLDNSSQRVTASVGIATTRYSETATALLRDADTAMYWAKTRGKDAVKLFEPEMHEAAQERLQIQAELKAAVDRQDFVLYYQPSFALDPHHLEGFEALVRWNHPELGLVSPDRFIPIAEETGLILPLGRWVMHEATRQMAEWSKEKGSEDLTIAINVSARQLRDERLLSDVKSALSSSGVAANRIVLEITESMLVQDPEDVARVLRELKDLGVRIAIDDFGTGYSSLSYLANLPIDILKIDRSFVSPATKSDDDGHRLLAAILDLARGTGLATVAEGVEQVEQAEFLVASDCSSGQGYLWARPLPANEALTVIREYGEGTAQPAGPTPLADRRDRTRQSDRVGTAPDRAVF
jgi:diguanylate cyclase (GGDEF)-like protein/PAS domain S-box-containing protein